MYSFNRSGGIVLFEIIVNAAYWVKYPSGF